MTDENENRLFRYGAACLVGAFAAVGIWLALRFLLPILLPVLIGYGLAAWIHRMGQWTVRHTGMGRLGPVGEKAGGMVLAAVLLAGILWGGTKGVAALAGQAGELVERAAGLWDWNALPEWITAGVPENLRDKIGQAVTALVEKGAGWLADAAGDVLSALPGAALAVFFTAASVFYWLADRTGFCPLCRK